MLNVRATPEVASRGRFESRARGRSGVLQPPEPARAGCNEPKLRASERSERSSKLMANCQAAPKSHLRERAKSTTNRTKPASLHGACCSMLPPHKGMTGNNAFCLSRSPLFFSSRTILFSSSAPKGAHFIHPCRMPEVRQHFGLHTLGEFYPRLVRVRKDSLQRNDNCFTDITVSFGYAG